MDLVGYKPIDGGQAQSYAPSRTGSLSPTKIKHKDNSGSKIKVAVRIRPLLNHEKQQGQTVGKIFSNNDNQVEVANNDANAMNTTQGGGGFRGRKVYNFDQVFNQEHSQDDVYDGLGISGLIGKVVEGYHGTVFAYGQTGSGKTFTMEGTEDPERQTGGITQRSITDLFEQIDQEKEKEPTKHISVFCSFLQIYNEKVFDLLNPSSVSGLTNLRKTNANFDKEQAGLRIRWTKKDQFVVENLYVFECQTYEEAVKLFKFGSQNKILATHNLNEFSSRSHSIFSLTIETQDIKQQVNVTISRLQLVDLAGSEKQSLTGTTGQAAKESIDINKSLTVLRRVITALTESKKGMDPNFIPYRESKLTQLLKQSLGGNSYTLMMACLSPSDKFIEENLSTLNYAAKASLISNIPTKNVDPQMMKLNEYKKKNQDIEKELRSANEHIQLLTQIDEEKKARIEYLENKVRRLNSQVQQHDSVMKQRLEEQKSNFDLEIKKVSAASASPLSNHRQMGEESAMSQFSANGQKLPEIGGRGPQMNSELKQISNNAPHINFDNVGSPTNRNDEFTDQPISPMRRSFSPTKTGMSGKGAFGNTTMNNFNFKQDKEKQEAAAERLIHSVNAVTDLLKANTKLRENVEKVQRDLEDRDAESFQLQIENQALKERLELVEGILKNNPHDYDELVSTQIKNIMEKSNTEYGKFGGQHLQNITPKVTTVDQVYTELIQLRNQNRALQGRVKQVETQNFNLTGNDFAKNVQQTGQNFNSNQQTPQQQQQAAPPIRKNNEPMRPNFNKQILSPQSNTMEIDESNEARSFLAIQEQQRNKQYDNMLRSNTVTSENPSFAKHIPLLNNNNGYQSESKTLRKKTPNQFRTVGQPPGLKTQYNEKRMVDNGQGQNQSYQPVPDGRFYTKANFFTLRNNSREGIISEQYQTDAEPAEQEIFDEMMYRRKQIGGDQIIQQPAVPGQPKHQSSMVQGGGQSPGGGSRLAQTIDYEKSPPGQQMMYQHMSQPQARNNQLEPINENLQNQQYNYPDSQQASEQYYPQPGAKQKKGKINGKHNPNGSMIIQMSNLMNKRKTKQRKAGNSQRPPMQGKGQYHQNDFYF